MCVVGCFFFSSSDTFNLACKELYGIFTESGGFLSKLMTISILGFIRLHRVMDTNYLLHDKLFYITYMCRTQTASRNVVIRRFIAEWHCHPCGSRPTV